MKINEWLDIDKTRGERGASTVSLTASRNNNTISRNDTLIVDNVLFTKPIIVEQKGKPINISIDLPYLILPPYGGEDYGKEITIITNGDWNITLPDGFQASQTSGNGKTTITIWPTVPNEGYEDKNVYITITTPTESFDFPIIQEAKYMPMRGKEFGFTCVDEDGCYISCHNQEIVGYYEQYIYTPTIGQFQYSKDGGPYLPLDDGVTLSKGETILVKGSLTEGYTPINGQKVDEFVVEGKTECFGDVRWLYTLGTSDDKMIFYSLFAGCDITTPPELPIKRFGRTDTYIFMFSGCKYLKRAPELPALIMTYGCYKAMFGGCISLETPPQLPAMILASNCYESMFYGCINLREAPALPALKLKASCYNAMFRECESLTKAPDLMAPDASDDIMSPDCTYDCYKFMFTDCKNLSYVKCATLPLGKYDPLTGGGASISGYWLSGVSPTGTFIGPGYYKRETSQVPEGWTIINEL